MAVDAGTASTLADAFEALGEFEAEEDSDDEFTQSMAQGLAAGASVLGAGLSAVEKAHTSPGLASIDVGRFCCQRNCLLLTAADDAFRDDLIGTLAEGNRLRDAVKTAQQYVPPVPITAPTGTRSPRLVLGGTAAAAAPPRIRRFLSDTHVNSTAVATRRDFLRRSFLQLHGDRNWCIDATRHVTRATMHDVYGRPTPATRRLSTRSGCGSSGCVATRDARASGARRHRRHGSVLQSRVLWGWCRRGAHNARGAEAALGSRRGDHQQHDR